eukprot:TRINITY_DN7860_c0_g1_i1.p2 TRINITY_DN7860_c0_g1~~TRINITY_DN7860_c0_g1_i1.p2  ORF type:complete len:232 (+),score=115.78 TRINITY_DN7860_c0_g1_i1:84-698(+)
MPSVQELIDAGRVLDDRAIQPLEEHVNRQIQEGTFDPDANIALLKLYQFHPAKLDAEILVKVLQKSLMELPSTSFVLCLYLVPERHHKRPEIARLLELHDILEECRFTDFWRSEKLAKLPAVNEFEQKIRDYIFGVIAISHQRGTLADAAECLNLAGAELEGFLQKKGCQIADGMVRYPLSEHNQKRPSAVQANVQVEQVARIW